MVYAGAAGTVMTGCSPTVELIASVEGIDLLVHDECLAASRRKHAYILPDLDSHSL